MHDMQISIHRGGFDGLTNQKHIGFIVFDREDLTSLPGARIRRGA